MDPLLAGVLVNFCMLLSTIAVMFVIDVRGRRILLLLGGGVMTVSMTVAAVLAKMIADMGDVSDDPALKETQKTYGYLLVVAVCIYAIGFGPWGAVPWVYPSEIFPMDVKEKAMSTSVFSQWGANFLIAFMVVGQVRAWGAWAQWHSTPCAAASCACTLPWACQRSKVCAWRIWSQFLVLERQLLRRDLQRLEATFVEIRLHLTSCTKRSVSPQVLGHVF